MFRIENIYDCKNIIIVQDLNLLKPLAKKKKFIIRSNNHICINS